MSDVTLVRGYATLFTVSTAFPIAASLMPQEAISRTMGVLDLSVASALLITAIYIASLRAPENAATDAKAVAWYRVSATVPLVLLAIFFVAGSHVDWTVLLVGLAWRAWLFWYTLPAALALLNRGAR
jgi:hypothetical protein